MRAVRVMILVSSRVRHVCKIVAVLLKFDMSMTACLLFFFQAEDGIRYLVRSRGLGDVYKRQRQGLAQRRPDGGHGLLGPLQRVVDQRQRLDGDLA